MRMLPKIFTILLIVLTGLVLAFGQDRPVDRPVSVTRAEVKKFQDEIKPYSDQARKTYPQAKARFLKGLPTGSAFYVTAVLTDATGKFEQSFIRVRKIRNARIEGSIANDIDLVSGYKLGDAYTVAEADIIDWTITDAAGNEEGNYVGKYLDSRSAEPQVGPTEWTNAPKTSELLIDSIEKSARAAASYGEIPRVAFFDIGYPRTADEVQLLDSNAVMLVTAITRSADDLPLKRLYVLSAGKETDLKLLDSNLSAAEISAEVTKSFGKYRYDALFLLPVALRTSGGEMRAVFGAGRDMKIADFGTPLSPAIAALNIGPSTGSGPSAQFLKQFISREFPAFDGN